MKPPMLLRYSLLIVCLFLLIMPVLAQDSGPFTAYSDFTQQLFAILRADDTASAQALADALWARLEANQQLPLVIGEKVAFLYRGEAKSVEWRGDFSGWERGRPLRGERVGQSNLWVGSIRLPINGRIEYKIVLNGDEWILDPANSRQVMSGSGPNNELAMPEFRVTLVTDKRADIPAGTVSDPVLIDSESLGYTLSYWVYTPADYDRLDKLPTLYVLDGNDFIREDMGSLITALDNLTADGKIQPLIAVLINARDPNDDETNRREQEFLDNPDYARFVAEELVPVIDENYQTNATPEGRTIMGTSYGGVGAAYIALKYPDVFDNVVMFSPSLWASQEIGPLSQDANNLPSRAFLGTGYPDWDNVIPQETRDYLKAQGVQYQYMETVEGHSWGNWRGMLDEMLTFMYGT